MGQCGNREERVMNETCGMQSMRPKNFEEMEPAEQIAWLKNEVSNLHRGLEAIVSLVDRLGRHTHDSHGQTCILFDWPRELNRWR